MSRPCPRRRLATSLAATLFFSSLTAPARAESWVPVANRALPLDNASVVGPVAPNQAVTITVALKLRNTNQLESFIAHVNTPGDDLYGQFLTPAQFTATYGPLASQAQAVASYLKTAGFSNVKIAPNRVLVTASGTAALAQTAFNTTLMNYSVGGDTLFGYAQQPMVPASLGGSVLAVLGMTNFDSLKYGPQPHATPDPTLVGAALSPQDLQKAYGVDKLPAALNTTVAILTTGNSMDPVLKDIAKFKKAYGLPDFPVTVVPVGDGPSTNTSGETEWAMDTQTSTGLAGGVKELIIYEGGSATTDQIAAAINQFAVDGTAKAASLSAGTCDFLAVVSGFMATGDQALMQAAAQGQTVFVASGDSGMSCMLPQGGGLSNGVPVVGVPDSLDYPSSSPYAVAVGGTTLFRDSDGAYANEISWDAGGGGISGFEPSPAWQSTVVPNFAATSASGIGRGSPDIAMDADFLVSPAAFYDGGLSSNGGTSLASPLALGAWARIESAHNNQLGFAAPALYQLATAPLTAPVALNDITVGSNGYPATPGWDYTTGLGSFAISAVSSAIKDITSSIHFTAPVVDGGTSCDMPGKLVNDDPAGDNLDAGVPGHDLRKVRIAEPHVAAPFVNAGDQKLVISMDIDDASSLPPQTIYFVFFTLADGVNHYVSLWTTPAPSGTPAVPSNPVSGGGPIDLSFAYGHEYNDPAGAELWFDNEGPTDAESTVDTANNRIIWVLSKNKIPGLANNAKLKGVNGAIWIEDSLFGLGDTESVDSATPADYSQVGNASCTGKAAGTDPVPAAGALPASLLLPLILLGLGRRARRAN